MTYPEGVVTRSVEAGGALSITNGRPLMVETVTVSSRALIHLATGIRVEKVTSTQKSPLKGESLWWEMPATDRSGEYLLADTREVIILGPDEHTHTYTTTVKVTDGVKVVGVYEVGPYPVPSPEDPFDTLDLDTMQVVDVATGTAIPIPSSWTATVAAAEEATALAREAAEQVLPALSDVAAIKAETTTGRLAEGRVAPLEAGVVPTEHLPLADIADSDEMLHLLEEQGSVVNVMNRGAAGDGVTDDTAAFHAAVAAVEEGGTVVFTPGRRYCLDGTLTNVVDGVPKTVNVIATGAVFVKSTNTDYLDMRGAWSEPVSVLSFSVSQTMEAGISYTTTTFAVESAPEWRRGDVVKVIADDIIPGSRSDDGTNPASAQRVGQFFSVYEATGTTVTVLGVLTDPATTNVRIARLEQNTVSWTGGVFTFSDEYVSAGFRRAGLRFEALHGPAVRDVTISRAGNQAVGMVSCYGYEVSNLAVGWARNDTTAAAYGYGVNDVSSHGGVVTGSRFEQVRHAFTDDTAPVLAGSNDISLYGRPRYASITDCVGSGDGVFNTHHSGEGHVFSGCRGINANTAFGIRGRNHTIADVTAQNCKTAVQIYTETASGESYGHRVDGLRSDGCATVVSVTVRTGTAHPRNNIRDDRPIVVRGIYATGVTGNVLFVRNATVLAEGVFALVEGTGARFSANNATLLYRDLTVDIRSLVTENPSDLCAFSLSSPSTAEIHGMRVIGDVAGKLLKVFSGASPTVVRASDVVLDSLPATRVTDTFGSGSYVDYTTVGAFNSGALPVAGADVGTFAALQPLGMRRDPVLTVEVNPSAAITLGDLPAGGINGQLLLVVNVSTFPVYVGTGGTQRTSLIGGVTKTIPAGESMLLAWSPSVSAWRQIAA